MFNFPKLKQLEEKEKIKYSEGSIYFYHLYLLIDDRVDTEEKYIEIQKLYNDCLNRISKIIIDNDKQYHKELIEKEIKNNIYVNFLLNNNISINGIIVVNKEQFAHFHVEDMIIKEAEYLGYIKGLPKEFHEEWFNKWFIDKRIDEAYYILKKMDCLQKDSELTKTVKIYQLRKKIRNIFIDEIINNIASLILEEDRDLNKIKEATELFNLDYNEIKNNLKLTLKKQDQQ